MKEIANYLEKPVIKIFVYGTLRKGQRLGFYMEGAKYLGRYYTSGQLMKSENDNVYIDFDYQQAITIGEVYLVNFYCLQRINHLEVLSGTFPKGYDLNILPVWKIENDNQEYILDNSKREIAFYYKWKNCPVKILTGDFTDDFVAIDELEKILIDKKGEITSDEILDLMKEKLSIFESFNF
jgi:gamma-glutamylcyclotransferase (GGCT)/AIG2-like uncharacterized protein YtfP